MKTNAIITPSGEYLKWRKSSPIPWNPGSRPNLTSDQTEAKHYKAAGSAKGIITQAKNYTKGRIKSYNEQLEHFNANPPKQSQQQPNNQNALATRLVQFISQSYKPRDNTYYEAEIERWGKHLEFIDTLTIVEIDVEKPNYGDDTTKERRFEKYGIGFQTKKSGGGNHCRCCGMYLKQIPMILFGTRKPGKVCPWCVEERAHEARKLIEEMDQTERESVEADRFLNMV